MGVGAGRLAVTIRADCQFLYRTHANIKNISHDKYDFSAATIANIHKILNHSVLVNCFTVLPYASYMAYVSETHG